MKSVVLSVFSSILLLSGTSAFAAKVDLNAAPADHYFGAQKMSAIGIRMRVDSLGRQYHARTISDQDVIHDTEIAEASLKVWQEKYPKDTWLPSASFHMAELYEVVQSQDAREHAKKMFNYVSVIFSKTKFGHLAHIRLQQGFPPLKTESPVVSPSPTSTPQTTPSPGETSPKPSISPEASSSPKPNATSSI